MKSRDRLAYRGLLAATVTVPVLAFIVAALGAWLFAALFGGVWMMAVAGLVHMQTRVLNSGARALRDSVAQHHGTVAPDSSLVSRLDSMSEDLAMVRAHANAEPTQDEVRADLVQLAQSLRREMRLLQYAVTIQDESSTVPMSAESGV